MWGRRTHSCVRHDWGVFRLQCQIRQAGLQLSHRWAAQRPVLIILSLNIFLCPLTSHHVYSSVAGIVYNLTLDALRPKARASFINPADKNDRRISSSLTIKDRETKCIRETFMMSASTLIFTYTWNRLWFLIWIKSTPKTICVSPRSTRRSIQNDSFDFCDVHSQRLNSGLVWFWRCKQQSCEESYAEEEDSGHNMKQTLSSSKHAECRAVLLRAINHGRRGGEMGREWEKAQNEQVKKRRTVNEVSGGCDKVTSQVKGSFYERSNKHITDR